MRGFSLGLLVMASGCNTVIVDEARPGGAASPDDDTTSAGDTGGSGGVGGSGATASGGASSGTAPIWSAIAGLAGCGDHTATALDDGRVLVVGECWTLAYAPLDALLVDPETTTFEAVAAPSARAGHTATRLPDGGIVIAGGVEPTSGASLAASWTYRPDLGFVETTTIAAPRFGHAATALGDGRVLLTGGSLGDRDPTWWETNVTSSAEIVSRAGEGLGAVASMRHDRAGHATASWAGGTVAIGGHTTEEELASVEWFDGTAWSELPALPEPLGQPAALTLTDGRVFVTASDGGLLLGEGGWIASAPAGPLYGGAAVAPIDGDDVLVVSWTAWSAACNVLRYAPARDRWTAVVRGPLSCGGAPITATSIAGGGVLVITSGGAAVHRAS